MKTIETELTKYRLCELCIKTSYCEGIDCEDCPYDVTPSIHNSFIRLARQIEESEQ